MERFEGKWKKDPKNRWRRWNDALQGERGYVGELGLGRMVWLGEVVLRAVGEYCIIGNGLEECLGCIRKLALGEWSQ